MRMRRITICHGPDITEVGRVGGRGMALLLLLLLLLYASPRRGRYYFLQILWTAVALLQGAAVDAAVAALLTSSTCHRLPRAVLSLSRRTTYGRLHTRVELHWTS